MMKKWEDTYRYFIHNIYLLPLNRYGDHYWMLDVDMDCSQTEQGWFEIKAFLTNDAVGWEGDITQVREIK